MRCARLMHAHLLLTALCTLAFVLACLSRSPASWDSASATLVRHAAAADTPEKPKASTLTSKLACSACHTTAGWKLRGDGNKSDGFDHASTGFPLTGSHASTSCMGCHIPDKPAPKRDCASCHADSHRGRLGNACDKCHSAVSWKAVQPVAIHRLTRFPLTGMHTLADCTECHQKANEHAWTGTSLECFTCHEKEYRRPTLRPSHVGGSGAPAFPRDCSLCHKAISWVPAFVPQGLLASIRAKLSADVAPADHDARFPISFGTHRNAACSDCHTSLATPRAVQCIGCHAHDAKRSVALHTKPVATNGASCTGCHPGGAKR
jgi:hypothetical protein